ncbi:MAG: AAA family ATPase [Bacteroidia bacterium]
MDILFEINNRRVSTTSIQFQRSLKQQINWLSRLVEIRGSRGVGKTTLLLQRVQEMHSEKPREGIYVSLDDAYFYDESLVNFADQYVKYGGTHLYLDEVHKYPVKKKGMDWSREVKIIYDRYPELYIVFTGSSILELHRGEGDLSRRRSTYILSGLSFREYLIYHKIFETEPIELSDILADHTNFSREISSKITVIQHFKDYLQYGYYPFYKEDPDHYYLRIKDVISLILESDIPASVDIHFDTVFKLKRLLGAIATSSPYSPNLTQLRADLQITDQRTLIKYLEYLEKAELLHALQKDATGNRILKKPDKLYLNNTNLMFALSLNRVVTGNIRETFFLNQLSYKHQVSYPNTGDFLVDDQYIFEVGGRGKDSRQIKDAKNAFIAADEIETGIGNKIPLWLFGFLY